MSASDTPDYASRQSRDLRDLIIRHDELIKAFTVAHAEYITRLTRIEDICEKKREQILALQPLVPAVFGSAHQGPGLMTRVTNLEKNTVTWPAVMTFSAICAAITSAVVALWHEIVK